MRGGNGLGFEFVQVNWVQFTLRSRWVLILLLVLKAQVLNFLVVFFSSKVLIT